MTVEKPKPKQLLRPITTGAGSSMNQSQFLAITCNSLEAREKSRVRGAIGFASHWLKNWRDSFKPITERSNRSNVITFDSHLKTALIKKNCCCCHQRFLSASHYIFGFFLSVNPTKLGDTQFHQECRGKRGKKSGGTCLFLL